MGDLVKDEAFFRAHEEGTSGCSCREEERDALVRLLLARSKRARIQRIRDLAEQQGISWKQARKDAWKEFHAEALTEAEGILRDKECGYCHLVVKPSPVIPNAVLVGFSEIDSWLRNGNNGIEASRFFKEITFTDFAEMVEQGFLTVVDAAVGATRHFKLPPARAFGRVQGWFNQ